jgi:hypothetical protein
MKTASVVKAGTQVLLVVGVAVLASMAPAREEGGPGGAGSGTVTPAPLVAPSAAPLVVSPAVVPEPLAALFRAECRGGEVGPAPGGAAMRWFRCRTGEFTLTARVVAASDRAGAGAREALVLVMDSRRGDGRETAQTVLMRHDGGGRFTIRDTFDVTRAASRPRLPPRSCGPSARPPAWP